MGARSAEVGRFRGKILKGASIFFVTAGSLGVPTSVATGINASLNAEKIPYSITTQDKAHRKFDSNTVGIAVGFAGTVTSEISLATGIVVIYRRRRSSTSENPPEAVA